MYVCVGCVRKQVYQSSLQVCVCLRRSACVRVRACVYVRACVHVCARVCATVWAGAHT